MKYSLTLPAILSAVLNLSLATALPSANPLSQRQTSSTVTIQLKTGDGDASAQNTLALNTLQKTQTDNLPFSSAVNGFVVSAGITCQAFSDAAGTTALGSTFTNTVTAVFSAGGEAGQDNAGVPLAAVCCAADGDFADDCGAFGAGDGTGSDTGTGAGTVRVELDTQGDEATQGEVPVDGSLYVLSAPLDGKKVQDAFIVDAEGAVDATCQAFADGNGKNAIGDPFSTTITAQLRGADVAALSCSAA